MKHPFYTAVAFLSCAYLATANLNGWSLIQSTASRSALNSTSYRYRPSFTSSSGGSGWSFHK